MEAYYNDGRGRYGTGESHKVLMIFLLLLLTVFILKKL